MTMGHGSSLVAEAGVWESHTPEQKGSTEAHTGAESQCERRGARGGSRTVRGQQLSQRMWPEGRAPVKRLASCGEGPGEGH